MRDIALRIWDKMGTDNLSVLAAGVGFFSMLAVFPAIAAALSVYGLFADPTEVSSHVSDVGDWIPGEAFQLLEQQLTAVAAAQGGGLELGVIIGIAFALWSASMGVKALMSALNVVYEEPEARGLILFNVVALIFTLGGIALTFIAIGLVVGLSALLAALPLPADLAALLSLGRWPILAGLILIALAISYRFGPSHGAAHWQWLSWGTLIATVLWLLASYLFSVYVANFADYNKIYGSLGAVVVLLMWFYITAFVVLLGAEINAAIERTRA